jgi:hypothetical protein
VPLQESTIFWSQTSFQYKKFLTYFSHCTHEKRLITTKIDEFAWKKKEPQNAEALDIIGAEVGIEPTRYKVPLDFEDRFSHDIFIFIPRG